MRRSLPFIAALSFWFTASAYAAPLANQLQAHPSPYLALHAADPVAWQDWSNAAVERARAENKLLYLSIGYFSCHWCHVMQRESYQHRQIAEFLNRHFIPVKIDRELEPALDTRLMEFSQATRGMAGWPLNVFITPQGAPLYATLYSPAEEFFEIVQRVQRLWQQDPKRLAKLAEQALPKTEGPGKPTLAAAVVAKHRAQTVERMLAQADEFHGGFGEESKFPSAPQLAFLLNALAQEKNPSSKNAQVEEFLLLTLDQMAKQGLHDHLNGGFFRYTVDPSWKTPHFEKMLYDNALLARLYLRAAAHFKRDDYLQVARRTLDFMKDAMQSGEGALVASLSALDAAGVEGGYYLWREAELRKLLTRKEQQVYRLAFGMTDAPPFDDGYLPITGLPVDAIAQRLEMVPQDVTGLLASAQAKLRKAQQQRRLPRDTKLLAAWNGLALSAFAEGFASTQEPAYRQAAEDIKDYLVKVLWDGRQLRRAVANGAPLGDAAIEDYAFVAAGLVDWWQVSKQLADLAEAKRIADEGWRRFYGPRGWRLSERSLIAAQGHEDVVADGPMPSPSAVLAETSLRIAAVTGDKALRTQALRALNTGYARLDEDPFWYATQTDVMAAFVSGRLRR